MENKMNVRILIILVTLTIVQYAKAVSFSLDTWILNFEPDMKKTSQVITLKYIGNEYGGPKSDSRTLLPIPIEFSIFPRFIDLDGTVSYDTTKNSPEFVIYPSQVILYPGDVQKIQIQWVSDKPLSKEMIYGLIALQVPVNLEGNNAATKTAQGGVTIVTRYEGIIVVKPKASRPEVIVDTIYSKKDSVGKTTLVFHLKNKGSGLQITRNMRLTVAPIDEKGHVELAKKIIYKPELSESSTKHALFAGQVRRYKTPWPESIPIGPVQIIPEFP